MFGRGISIGLSVAILVLLSCLTLPVAADEAQARTPFQLGVPCRLGRDVPAPVADILVLSDHPECVKQEGLLCQGGLHLLRSVRFQFYHQGGCEHPIFLVLRLRNRGKQTARLSAVAGAGLGTELDYFRAGHQNNTEFLPNLLQGRGRLIELRPGEEITFWSQELTRDIVASGTVQWCLLQGQEVEYSLYSSFSPAGPFYSHLLSDSQDVHARGFYPEPERYRRSVVDVSSWQGERGQETWAIGATRQPSALCGPELKGDYGVLYRWELTLNNRSDAPKLLEFCLNPRGGKATGTFCVNCDGEWHIWEQKSELEAFQFASIAECCLAPHSSKTLLIYTIPEGASNYPVRLVVRPRAEVDGT